MRHGSLFSGIGGFDLAASWVDWENVFHCENNKFCKEVLEYYWPNAESYDDIKQTDFNIWRGRCEVISGGFPCQPYSIAGQRKGNVDDRHLWPEMFRAIREIQPHWVVGENVYGLLNWQRGMVFNQIKTDLEVEGFEVFPPIILPACGKDAKSERVRLWIVAHSKRKHGNSTIQSEINGIKIQRQRQKEKWSSYRKFPELASGGERSFDQWLGEPDNLFNDEWISERLDTIAISKEEWIRESLKAGGNAIVPQIAYEIFKTIKVLS